MALLADYAITPDVFDVMSYPNEEVCEARLELIREPLLTEGLVRDIRDGEWRKLIENPARAWHRRGKELIRKLATQGRLVQFSSALPNPPVDDQGWCAEALESHRVREFAGGIIVTEAVKNAYFHEPLVSRIDRLGNARWWAARSPSVTLTRSPQDYQQHLDPILRCANSLMFTRLLHKSWHVVVTQAPAFSVARAWRSSPSSLSLLFIDRIALPAGRMMRPAR